MRFAFWHGKQSGKIDENQGETQGQMVQRLYDISSFVRSLRTKLRFGSLSRTPLRLLRFQLQGRTVECDWMARLPDEWDMSLPIARRERTATQQAFEDAMAVRAWLFRSLPDVESATFRVYRECCNEPAELIMTGTITREEPNIQVLSLAMRAKLYGFRFWLDDGILAALSE